MANVAGTDIVALLSAQEEAIAALYAAFSVTLPEMKIFWENLVVQEKAHADVLRQLAGLCESKNVALDQARFNAEAIRTNIDNMTKTREKVMVEGVTARRALALSADIEQSLIEKEYFHVIQSDLVSVRKELAEIERHTKQHLAMVSQRLAADKKQAGASVRGDDSVKEQVVLSQRNIINSLVRCEEGVSRLYALYSKAVPEMEKFWSDLSGKEEGHAKLLKSLHTQLDQGFLFFEIGRFESGGVESFLAKVNDAIRHVEANAITPREAVGTALLIEGSIVEAHFYDIVRSDSKVFTIIANRLSTDTHDHVKAVQKQLLDIQARSH